MKVNIVLMAMVMSFLTGCTGMKVLTDQKENVDFGDFLTYEIRYEEGFSKQSEFFNELNTDRFDAEMQQALAAKGMRIVEEDPDVYIDVATSTEVLTNYSTTYNAVGGRRFYGNRYATSDTREYNTKLENVVVALRDGDTNELLWYATLTKELRNNPKKAQEAIHNAVEKLMEQFPVQHEFPASVVPVS